MSGLQLAACVNSSLQEEKQFLLQKWGFELIANNMFTEKQYCEIRTSLALYCPVIIINFTIYIYKKEKQEGKLKFSCEEQMSLNKKKYYEWSNT